VRKVSKLLVAATAAAALTVLAATPALADPPTGTTPKPTDVVGVGSDTIESLFNQLSVDYNKTHTSGKLYSFDATPQNSTITTKSGSSNCTMTRPFGSTAGITQLEQGLKTTGGALCVDFARSSRDRATTDPTNISFIDLAGDAVTVATQPHTNAPLNLLTHQVLAGIFSCQITQWNQIPGNSGGSSATIAAMLPQNGSGTRSFFLGAIGLTTPGGCVSTSATRQGAAGNGDNTLEENEGVDPSLNTNTANVIFPFSVGKWIAQKFHSASCGTVSQCFANETNCPNKTGKNLFGCDLHGTMVLDSVDGTKPTVGTGTGTVINKSFTSVLRRLVFEVVAAPAGTIPTKLKSYFGPTGFTCNSATATKDLKNYGFLALPKGAAQGDCGSAH